MANVLHYGNSILEITFHQFTSFVNTKSCLILLKEMILSSLIYAKIADSMKIIEKCKNVKILFFI